MNIYFAFQLGVIFIAAVFVKRIAFANSASSIFQHPGMSVLWIEENIGVAEGVINATILAEIENGCDKRNITYSLKKCQRMLMLVTALKEKCNFIGNQWTREQQNLDKRPVLSTHQLFVTVPLPQNYLITDQNGKYSDKWSNFTELLTLIGVQNLRIECDDMCLMELAVPYDCKWDPDKRLITLKVRIPLLSSTRRVLTAHPFRIQRMFNYCKSKSLPLDNVFCNYAYCGPPTVVYNINNPNCIVEGPAFEIYSPQYIWDSELSRHCYTPMDIQQLIEIECTEFRDGAPQFQHISDVDNVEYLYCPTGILFFGENGYECPENIFSLTNFSDFRVTMSKNITVDKGRTVQPVGYNIQRNKNYSYKQLRSIERNEESKVTIFGDKKGKQFAEKQLQPNPEKAFRGIYCVSESILYYVMSALIIFAVVLVGSMLSFYLIITTPF